MTYIFIRHFYIYNPAAENSHPPIYACKQGTSTTSTKKIKKTIIKGEDK